MKNLELIDQVTTAVLYEGYILYPYRGPSVNNQQRWNFGVVYPRAYAEAQGGSDSWSMQTECLLLPGAETELEVKVRFLQLVDRTVAKLQTPLRQWPIEGDPVLEKVDRLELNGQSYQSWEEATEREVSISCGSIRDLEQAPKSHEFMFVENRTLEPLRDDANRVVAVIVRQSSFLRGEAQLSIERAGPGVFRLRLLLINLTPFEVEGERTSPAALKGSMLSVHSIAGLTSGEFISMFDPPEQFRSAAAACSNVGTWPVLVGEEGERDTILSSPIILYDYPRIAAEGAGELFDNTEIDEILSLRVMTLTDEEKRAMRAADDRARRLLERIDALPIEQFRTMHGKIEGRGQKNEG